MNQKFILSIFFVTILHFFSISQNLEKSYKYFDKINYNIYQGLKNSQMMCIVEDSNGYIWSGGGEGITKFSGTSQITYTTKQGLPSNPTKVLYIDKKGKLWRGGYDGSPAYFNGTKFIKYANNDSSICSNLIINCFTEDSNLIISTNKGIYMLSNKRLNKIFTKWFDKNTIFSNIIYYNKKFYISTLTDIWETDNKSYCNKIYSNKLLKRGGTFTIINGRLYFSYQNIIKLENNKWIDFIKSNDPSKFTNLSIDKFGMIWFAKNKLYNFKNNKIDSLKETDSKTIPYYFCYIDRKNKIWTNESTDGISYLTRKNVDVIKSKYLYSRYTKSQIYKDSFLIYINDKLGNLVKMDINARKIIPITPIQTINKLHINNFHILNDNKNIILTDGINSDDIFRVNIESKKIVKIYAPNNSIPNGIFQNQNDDIYVAANKAIYKLKNDSLILFKQLVDITEPIYDISIDKDNCIWLLGQTKLYYKNNENYINVNNIINEKETQFSTISYYKEYIIAGSIGNGIYIFKKNKYKNIYLYDHLTVNDGLVDDVIYRLFVDSLGNCLTQNNFIGFNYIKSITSKDKRKILSLDKNYIKKIDFRNIELLYQNPKTGICNLYVDSTIIRFDTSIINDLDKEIFKINLNDIELFRTKIDWEKKGFKLINDNIPEELKLRYNENFITFNFNAIKFENIDKIKYQYKLIGTEDKWIGPTTENVATFNNLNPGYYTFIVKGIGSGNVESLELKYSFEILPPWWNTVWFKFLILLFILGIIIGFIQYKTYSLKVQNEKLNIKVKERTNELEKSIKENQMLLTIITHDLKGPIIGIGRILNHINANWENTSENIRKEVINTLNNSTKKLITYTTQFLTWMKFKKDNLQIIEDVNINEIIDEIIEKQKDLSLNNNEIIFKLNQSFSVKTNKQILSLIINNIIDNSCKYTLNGRIEIILSKESGNLVFCCKDNGIGMTENQINDIKMKIISNSSDFNESFKIGWNILVELIEKCNMSFDIKSKINEGTEVYLYLKYS